MSLTDYQLEIYDPVSGARLDIIDNRRIQRLTYNRVINDTSRLTLTLMPNDRAQVLFEQVSLIMVLYRANNGTDFEYEDTFLSRYWQIAENANGIDYITVGADHLLSLFQYRLVLPADDPSGANGYSTKSGIADLVMYDYVDNQAINPNTNIDRIIPNLTNDVSLNLGQDIFMREQYSSKLLDVLKRATVLGNVDFRLIWTSANNFQFQVNQFGRNLTQTDNYPFAPFLLFAPERRNMKQPKYTINRYDEITATYVATQGIGENRTVTEKTSPNVYLPLNRKENVIDQRQIEDGTSFLDAITTAANAELRKRQPKITFTFDVDNFASQARYNQDWILGDRVTAQYMGYSNDLRIKEVKIDITKTEEKIEPKFEIEVE